LRRERERERERERREEKRREERGIERDAVPWPAKLSMLVSRTSEARKENFLDD